jgi:hypothetical protein
MNGPYTISREGTSNLTVWESTDLLEMVYCGDPNTREF